MLSTINHVHSEDRDRAFGQMPIISAARLDMKALQSQHAEKERKKLAGYESVLETCHLKIKAAAGDGHQTLLFSVPVFEFGSASYSLNSAVLYLLANLGANGFDTKFIYPRTLWICWAQAIKAATRRALQAGAPVITKPHDEKFRVCDPVLSRRFSSTLEIQRKPVEVSYRRKPSLEPFAQSATHEFRAGEATPLLRPHVFRQSQRVVTAPGGRKCVYDDDAMENLRLHSSLIRRKGRVA